MALSLGTDWVAELNKTRSDGSKFIKVAELTEEPGVVKYWCDHEESFVYNGNTYTPLPMRWENFKTSQSMTIEGWTVSVTNLSGEAKRYLKRFDPSGCPVWLRLLHTRLMASTTTHWKRYGKVLKAAGNNTSVTFTIARELGRNMQPNEVYLQSEWPSLTSEIPKIF
jgi:hypothetical protein